MTFISYVWGFTELFRTFLLEHKKLWKHRYFLLSVLIQILILNRSETLEKINSKSIDWYKVLKWKILNNVDTFFEITKDKITSFSLVCLQPCCRHLKNRRSNPEDFSKLFSYILQWWILSLEHFSTY